MKRENPFSSELLGWISSLGNVIDSMMAHSGALSLLSGKNPRGALSKLNARLVNEVILLGGRIPENEAKTRVRLIEKDTELEKAKFSAAGVRLGERLWMSGIRQIPKAGAESLTLDFDTALDLYPALVDRYAKSQDPKIGKQLSEIGVEIFWMKNAFDRLSSRMSGSDDVEIDLSETLRMADGVSDIFQVNETLKRAEGVLGKRADVTAPSRKSAWESIALASGGLATIGAVLYMATK